MPEHDPNRLAAFVENRLDPAERVRLEAHLIGCAQCRRTLAAIASVQHELAPKSPKPGEQTSMNNWLQRPTVMFGLAAAVILAAVVTFAILRTGQHPPQNAGVSEGAAPRAVEPPVPAPRPIERRVGGKRFRLDAGEWIDTSFDPAAMLPAADVESYEARSALLREKPRLAPYASLGSRVTVVFDGMVYRFDVK